MKNDQQVPVLLLGVDGYQIETVFVGRQHYTGWILLHRWPYGTVTAVASGWTKNYAAARREAFEAMKIHKADVEAAKYGSIE